MHLNVLKLSYILYLLHVTRLKITCVQHAEERDKKNSIQKIPNLGTQNEDCGFFEACNYTKFALNIERLFIYRRRANFILVKPKHSIDSCYLFSSYLFSLLKIPLIKLWFKN